jgi:hypothetical protein
MERPKVFNDCGAVLWTLYFQRKRIDGCTNEDKDVTIAWWACEIRVNPNKRDVTRQRIEVGIYDEKPTHYLMETNVYKSTLLYAI